MTVRITRLDAVESLALVSPSQGFGPSVETTDHPIEDGSTVTDHAQPQPTTISVEGIVSQDPLVGPDQTLTGELLRDAVAFFDRAETKPLRVETDRLGDFETVLLESYDHEVDKWDRLAFDLEFKEVEFATFETVEIPPEAPSEGADSEMPDEQDQGKQLMDDDVAAVIGRTVAGETVGEPAPKKRPDPSILENLVEY